jgi:hypothetical protein
MENKKGKRTKGDINTKCIKEKYRNCHPSSNSTGDANTVNN